MGFSRSLLGNVSIVGSSSAYQMNSSVFWDVFIEFLKFRNDFSSSKDPLTLLFPFSITILKRY